MKDVPQALKDHGMELIIGNLLRTGVLTAAGVVFLGGVLYLFRHGFAVIHYHIFQPVPSGLCNVKGIVRNSLSFHGRGLIQLGLLILIATPVARVFFSMIAFVRQRDVIYILVTAAVLTVLAHSLLSP